MRFNETRRRCSAAWLMVILMLAAHAHTSYAQDVGGTSPPSTSKAYNKKSDYPPQPPPGT